MKRARVFLNTDSFAPAHSGIRPAHCAALGAGSELVVLVFEQDATNLRLPISELKLTRIAPARSPLPIAALPSVSPIPSARLPILKGSVIYLESIRAASSDFEARRLLPQSARHRRKELLAQVQCLSLHCSGTKPIPYRSQELISVPLIFCRVPCVINRSHIELIERYFRVPIELRDRIRDQPVLREEDQIVGVHAIV